MKIDTTQYVRQTQLASADAAAMLIADQSGRQSLIDLVTELRDAARKHYTEAAEAQIISGNINGYAAHYLGQCKAHEKMLELITNLTTTGK